MVHKMIAEGKLEGTMCLADRVAVALRQVKCKVPVEHFVGLMEGAETIYDHERMKRLTYDDLMRFVPVFDYRGTQVYDWRNQLTDFVAKNKEFYHFTVEGMIARISSRIGELNEARVKLGIPGLPCINLFPEYGGPIQHPKACEYRQVHLFRCCNIQLPMDYYYYDKWWECQHQES